TRSKRDWSSDVCSSDLVQAICGANTQLDFVYAHIEQLLELDVLFADTGRPFVEFDHVLIEVYENIEVMAQNRGGLEQCVLWGQRSEERRVGKGWGWWSG